MINKLLSRGASVELISASKLYDEQTFYKAFIDDLRKAKREVIIESPFITRKRMEELMPAIVRLRKRGLKVTVNTRNPYDHDDDYVGQAIDAVADLQQIGVLVLYTTRHHRKLAIIDRQITWEGSLNILSQNNSCEFMRRIVSELSANQLISFINMEKYLQ